MADPKPTRSLFARALDRAELLLFPRDRSADRASTARRANGMKPRSALKVAAQRTAVGLCSVMFVVGFVFAVYFYSSTAMRIGRHPLVTNLTASGLQARIGFVKDASCDDGPQCWLSREFDDSTWTAVRVPMLPSAALQSVQGYDRVTPDTQVVYRMWVPVTDAQLGQPDEISFTPVYVNHTRFAAYVNGRLSLTSNGELVLGAVTNIALPRADIVDGKALVTIVGSYERSQPGLSSRAQAYVGPKPILDEVYIHVERVGATFSLLFLLSKGGIFVVFALFFIFSKGQRGLYSFLVFSFFLTIENLFVGGFTDGLLEYYERDAIRVLAKVVATVALMAYLADFYEVHRKRRLLAIAGSTSLLVFAGLVYDYGWGTRTVTPDLLLRATNAFLLSVIVLGLAAGVVTYRMWSREGFAEAARRNLRNLWLFLALYLGLLVWEFGFNAYYGFDKRPLFDLLLFYYMVFLTARDFGLKEGQVRTLEAHMIEKRRMEVELQEAAEIAKVFMPDTLPTWPGMGIRSHHQPLTENSGDWFAFESARGRRLHHFLMCDVTGHGFQAAIIVSACKTVLSLLVQSRPEVLESDDFAAQYAKALNAVLFKQGEGQHISTLLGLSFDGDKGVVHYCSGGHPAPVFLQKGDGRPVVQALVTRNTVLGSMPSVDFKLASRELAPGDSVLAYTDGLPLSPNIKVLREALSGAIDLDAPGGLGRLFTKVWEAHTAKTAQTPDDDVSIVVFRFLGDERTDQVVTSTPPARGSESSAS